VLLVDTRQVRRDPCRPIIISSSYSLLTWRWRWLIPPKCRYALPYHKLPQRSRPKISSSAVECRTVLRAFLHSESRFLSNPAQHWFSDKQFPCLSCLRFVFRQKIWPLSEVVRSFVPVDVLWTPPMHQYLFIWLKDTKPSLSSSYLRSRRRTSFYGLCRAHKTPPLNPCLLQSLTEFHVSPFLQVCLNNISAVSPVFPRRSLRNTLTL